MMMGVVKGLAVNGKNNGKRRNSAAGLDKPHHGTDDFSLGRART